jgi:general secretion pathway protein G
MKLTRNPTHSIHGRSPSAFTLVEMLLVLVILSTLAAIVYPNVTKQSTRARIAATKTQIAAFRAALAAFEIDNGHFPQGRNGLLELVQRPREAQNWRGPYLDGGIPKDRWGHEFLYECPGKHNPETYDIVSMGPDGALGTEDDIATWQPND